MTDEKKVIQLEFPFMVKSRKTPKEVLYLLGQLTFPYLYAKTRDKQYRRLLKKNLIKIIPNYYRFIEILIKGNIIEIDEDTERHIQYRYTNYIESKIDFNNLHKLILTF